MDVNDIRIQSEDFSFVELFNALKSEDASCGAIVTFTGIVREHVATGVEKLYLEHYPGMTEKALEHIVEKARARWALGAITIIHRVGELSLNENIVFVGVSSAHRASAFEAAQYLMDYLKKDAPFWKKEMGQKGDVWVEQKESDLAAANRWHD